MLREAQERGLPRDVGLRAGDRHRDQAAHSAELNVARLPARSA